MIPGEQFAAGLALAGAALIVPMILLWRQRCALQSLAQRLQVQSLLQHETIRVHAAAEERERIYGNLHDDFGTKLLQLIYTAATPEQADAARSLLQDVRDVVTRSRGAPGTLLQAPGEIRSEAEQRLRSVGIAQDCQQPDDLPDPDLDQGQSLHFFRIVREAISNVIRRARRHCVWS
ncbi:MAG: hypothetical protein SGI99_12470 [Pseudomonadota bacterium]|nr:hypothetical protein [Pseudomonadota bacterium]